MNKINIIPASKVNFKSIEVKEAFEKVKKLNKLLSEQSKIDEKKLSIRITI